MRRHGSSHSLRAKLTHGERHIAEDATGIVLVHRSAFLFGNTPLGRLHKILCGTNNAYNRENAKRHDKIASSVSMGIIVIIEAQGCIQRRGYGLGKVALATATAAIALRGLFNNLCSKQNGIHDLYDCYLIGMF